MTLTIYYSDAGAEGSLFWDDGESELFVNNALRKDMLYMRYTMTADSISASCFRESPGTDCYFELPELLNNILEKVRLHEVNSRSYHSFAN